MMYISLGQFNIPVAWLAFILAILYSDFRSRKVGVATNKLLEHLVFTYILVWKFSYILFSLSDFIKAPLSLVYFDGGLKGHVLALVVLAFILYRKRQILVWADIWIYWARVVAIFSVISLGFQEHWLYALIWLLVLVLIERKYQHGLLLGQFLLLAWLNGFTSSLTLVQLFVLLTVYLKTKQAQYLVVTGILSLVAMMLVDVEKATETIAHEMIDLPTTTGEMYSLSEQEQKLTVVNFFATWCPPCKAEMPHLQSFAEDLPAGVALIGVNLTDRDNGEQALVNFMETYEVTYPILLDESDEVGTAFRVMSIPTTVLLNAQGEELERLVGPVSEEVLRQLIKKHQTYLEE
ncbi:TlpA family protein disulfide reductase [Solibacillus sp. FSL K6-1126]|uniref:TlpA family protein disulfide reductase n=1 Tax=Solibacillus sp. FSL K6-1126 TaxID=2921463 RepID=UPI0030FB4CEA